jgi:transposase
LKRIGQDVAEKLDYQPGVFTVERHIRGKWVCAKCETLVQAPVPAHVIDKGIPTTGLLAQVLVAKYADHLPLYRQENIFARAGLALPRSTLAQWVGQCGVQLQPLADALRAELLRHSVLHADETPVAMLKPGHGKTHRAYLWSYCTTTYNQMKAVVFDFADSRAGQHARDFLGLPGASGWQGSLVCDDFSGYKACFEMGVTEAGCLAHARRKFHELWAGGAARRQQLGRKSNQADCHRAQQLAICRVTARGQTRCSSDEPGALGAAQRTRSLRILARCVAAVANASGQSRRRAAAAPLAGPTRAYLTLAAVVKMGSPRAYVPDLRTAQVMNPPQAWLALASFVDGARGDAPLRSDAMTTGPSGASSKVAATRVKEPTGVSDDSAKDQPRSFRENQAALRLRRRARCSRCGDLVKPP